MGLKSFLLKNKVFSILTLLFSICIVIFLVLAGIGTREIVFYDALGQNDVSAEYFSVLPWLRYVIEPFAVIAFILEYEFTWLFLFLIIYPILRVIYVFLRKRGKLHSKKYNQLKHVINDFIFLHLKSFQ